MVTSRGGRPHRVVALLLPPQAPFELGCAAEVFAGVRAGSRRRYEFEVCAERPGPVPTTAGFSMNVAAGPAALERADTVVIPGWTSRDVPIAPAIVAALRRAHARGARLASICTGAFALAQTGLLDGRRATTHWACAAELQARHPAVLVDPDVLYIDHGDVATSAGAGAGLDLCLHLVRTDHGAAHAAQLARQMVLPPHREGGQAQYATVAPPPVTHPSLATVLDWALRRLAEPITVDDLAGQLRGSSRTLARRFHDELGTSPGRWLRGQRIAAARALLEETDLAVETIAQRVGLSSATNLRRRFQRALGTTPGAYRRAFRLGTG